MLYFAYGSNMSTSRLQARVSACRFCAVAKLPGYMLRFHKRGMRDGTGKCNVWQTGNATDAVFGVVFELDAAQEQHLDVIEGVGAGYHKVYGEVVTLAESTTLRCMWYEADADAVDDTLLPYAWYKDFVLSGAREHGLPADYIRRIAGVGVLE